MFIIASVSIRIIQSFCHKLVVVIFCSMISLWRRGFFRLYAIGHFGFSIHFDAEVPGEISFILNRPGIRQLNVIFRCHWTCFCGKQHRAAGFFQLVQFFFRSSICRFNLHRVSGLDYALWIRRTLCAGPGRGTAQQKQCKQQYEYPPYRMCYNFLFLKHFCLSFLID